MDSDQESDCDLWDRDEPGLIEQNILSSVPICARRKVVNQSQPPVPGVLNDDCWKYILDYVPLEDIEWSKHVSRDWQQMVHRYMQGVRLRIETISNVWDVDELIRRRQCRVLALRDDPLCFTSALNRWGESVRELVYDAKDASIAELRGLGEKCPNLEDITFVRLRWHAPVWVANFRNLKRVCFENSSIVDRCIGEFLRNNPIEELVFRMSGSFSGSFFVTEKNDDLKTLKTLVLSNCLDLELNNLLAAAESGKLTQVTKFELSYCGRILRCRRNLLPRISKLFDKMSQLEHLTLDCDVALLDEEVVASVARLERLKHLGWHNGEVFRGKELHDVRKDTSLLATRPSPKAQQIPMDQRPPYFRQMDDHFRFRLQSARESYIRRLQEHRQRQQLPEALEAMLDFSL